jgi:hypothetical protein
MSWKIGVAETGSGDPSRSIRVASRTARTITTQATTTAQGPAMPTSKHTSGWETGLDADDRPEGAMKLKGIQAAGADGSPGRRMKNGKVELTP